MKTFVIFLKTALEQIRDSKNLLITIISPVFFVVVFSFFFGKSFYTMKVAISNEDTGSYGKEFVEMLKAKKESNGASVFIITELNKGYNGSVQDIKKKKYHAHLVIPADFSDKIKNANNIDKSSDMVITGDSADTYYFFSQMTLESDLVKFIQSKGSTPPPVKISLNEIVQNKVGSEYDNMAPGFIIISAYFLLITSAMLLGREAENGTLQRMLFSKLKAWELFIGLSLSQLVLGAVMLAISYIAALMVGFKPNGSVLLAAAVGLVSTMSAIGIGLIIAAFSKSATQASNIGNVVLTPMYFITGIFIEPPTIKLFTMFDRDISLLTFIPPVHSVAAAKKVLLGGAKLSDISFEFGWLIALTIVIYIIGIITYNRRYINKYQAWDK